MDIGSDHGYLLILLREKYPDLVLAGVENKKGPFTNLKNNVSDKNIECFLSDGLNAYDSNYDTIVMAGMGFLNMQKIVNKNIKALKHINYILIDSHNMIPEAREFFCRCGYKIIDERIIKEDDIFYELLLFEKGVSDYSKKEYQFGPILLKSKNAIFIEKYNVQIEKLNYIKNNNKLNQSKIDEIDFKIKSYKEILNEN